MARPPELPVVTRNVLPGEGWVQGPVKLSHSIVIYGTWRHKRERIAAVRAGTTVTLLGGLNIIYKPDEIVVTRQIPNLQLSPGDTMLPSSIGAKAKLTCGRTAVGFRNWMRRLQRSLMGEPAVSQNAKPEFVRWDTKRGGFDCT